MVAALELLEDPAYRHVLLNHLPITGLAVAWLGLCFSLYSGHWSSRIFALAVAGLLSLSGLLVMATGDDAYPLVFDSLDGYGRDWLDHHVHLAERWGHLLTANAVLACVAIGSGCFRARLQTPLTAVVLVSTLAALAGAVTIAEAGGVIRHAEFRVVDPPVHDVPGRLR